MFKSTASSMQSILNSGSGKNLKVLSTLFDEEFKLDDNESIRTHKVLEVDGDFLVLSCAQQRLVKQNQILPYTKFYSSQVISKVIEADYIKALNIRDYYSKQMMLWKIKDCKLSKFREELNIYIHGAKNSIKESFVGMVCRLPEMYDYDLEFDELKPYANTTKTRYVSKNFELKFKKKLLWKQKNSARMEYYFVDHLDNLWCLPFDHTNQLLQVFDRILVDKISIHTTPAIRKSGEFSWYEASKWELNE
jgi:hypothetical protein